MKGRRPKPSHLKLMEGNKGHRPINENEPQSKSVYRPSAPDHFDYETKAIWDEVVVVIDDMGILKVADLIAVEMLIEAIADHRAACAAIRANKRRAAEAIANGEETDLSVDGRSYRCKNQTGGFMWRPLPAIGQKSDADRRIKAWASEFGMTPSARSRIVVGYQGGGKEENPDEADEFFAA